MIGAAVIVCALVAGIFYAFSSFVMGALGRLEPPAGIAAMQSINVVVLRPSFFLAFFGAGVVVIAAAVGSPTPEVIGGGALYLVGCLGVTIVRNVPLKERLACLDAASAEGAAFWQDYLRRWTRWNSVRTAASLAAAIVLWFGR